MDGECRSGVLAVKITMRQGEVSSLQPDFFNNVAAVAVVLIFTKVVSQRLRHNAPESARRVAAYHVATVISATSAIVIALTATAIHSDAVWLSIAAGVSLGVAGFMFICDEIRQTQHRSRPTGADSSKRTR